MSEDEKYLNVFYNQKKVGKIIQDSEERLSFFYAKEWLEDKNSFSLSVALKLSNETFGHMITKSFFENLLPEGDVKTILENTNKKNISDEFSFLREYGIDCSGAFVVSEFDKLSNDEKFRIKEISLESIYDYLENKQSLTAVMINEHGGKFSLAGAQDKFPIIYQKNKLFLPQNGGPTTHIIKPCVRYHRDTMDTPYNEYFCMQLANAVGLNVPKVILLEGKFPLYLIERFDRKVDGNKIIRIHQQDFCQAHGITSKKKYEEDGGPGIVQNYQLIKNNSSLPIKDLAQFIKWLWFNIFIGNNDCHSKNLSLVCTDEGLRLAPFYDLLSTVIYKDLTKSFSYSIGGQWKWHALKKKNFLLLAQSLGIDNSLIFSSGKDMIKKMNQHLEKSIIAFEASFYRIETAKKIGDEITKRIKFLQTNILS